VGGASHSRSVQQVVVLIFVCVLLVDFSSFALKYILWVPPRNPLNTYRLLLWCFLGMLSVREFYEYSTNPLVKRLGHHAWLGAMIMLTEALVWSSTSLALAPLACATARRAPSLAHVRCSRVSARA